MNSQTEKTKRAGISVIITSYNQVEYLQKTIQSVLTQSLQPTEIIICDDHSTQDNSWEVIKVFQSQYPQLIKVFRQEKNLGFALNRGFALQQATCKWITWVDGDDLFLPTKLEREWQTSQEHSEAMLIYSNVIVIDQHGTEIDRWHHPIHIPLASGDVFVPVFGRQLFPEWNVEFRNPLVHRKVFENIGYFDENLRLYEDWDWTIRATAKYAVFYSGATTIQYRLHPKGISHGREKKHHDVILEVYRKNISLARERTQEDQWLIADGIARALETFKLQI